MPPADNSNHALQLISEILDKMIETQTSSTEATTSLKGAVDTNSKATIHNTGLLEEILAHFSNGFRSEIKNHINERSQELQDQINTLTEQSQKLNDMLSRPWYWVKLILTTVAATATAVGAIVAVVIKMLHP
jgi:hypothetical protein